jgi:hypothetical protein
MRRAKATTHAGRRADDRPEVDPELRELLDHLGRLLAKEYVRALAGEAADEAAPRPEQER